MFFNEDHLRITKVRTADGITPVFGENGKPETKIVYAPDTKETIKLFNELNSRLPTHLKMKLDKVPGYTPQQLPSQPVPDVSALEKEIAELKALNQLLLKNQEVSESGSGETAAKPSKETKPKLQTQP